MKYLLTPFMILSIATAAMAAAERCDQGVSFNDGASYQNITGEVTCKYEGGGLSRKTRFDRGIITAEQRYTEQGTLLSETVYKQGKRNGIAKEYDPKTGKLRWEQNYENDSAMGLGKRYFPDGATLSSMEYINPADRSRTAISLNKQQQPTSIECGKGFPADFAAYCKGPVQLYSSEGAQAATVVPSASGYTGTVANADGATVAYKDGKRDGTEKIMGKNGHVARINNYAGGQRVGEQVEYFDDSDQIKERYYIDPTSYKRTKSEAFFQNGQLSTLKESLTADRYRIQAFYDNGKPAMEATLIEKGECDDFYGYCSDKPVGESKIYNRDGELVVSTHDEKGNIIKTVKYDANGREDETKHYYPDGSVKQ